MLFTNILMLGLTLPILRNAVPQMMRHVSPAGEEEAGWRHFHSFNSEIPEDTQVARRFSGPDMHPHSADKPRGNIDREAGTTPKCMYLYTST